MRVARATAATATALAFSSDSPMIGEVLKDGSSPGECGERAIYRACYVEESHAALCQAAHGRRACVTRQDDIDAVKERAQCVRRVKLQTLLGRKRSLFYEAERSGSVDLVHGYGPRAAEMRVEVCPIGRRHSDSPLKILDEVDTVLLSLHHSFQPVGA